MKQIIRSVLAMCLLPIFCFADAEEEYFAAYARAKEEKKVLWIHIGEKELSSPPATGVYVRLPPSTTLKGVDLAKSFFLGPDTIGDNLILVDLRNDRLDVYGNIVGKLNKASECKDADLTKFHADSVFDLTPTEREMVDAADAYRARFKKGPLKISTILMKAARDYADDGIYSHPHAGSVAAKHGFPGRTTENLAQGRMSGRRVIEFWGEPGVGHEMQQRGLINVNGQWIDGGFTHMGVAHYNNNWIIYFGSARK